MNGDVWGVLVPDQDGTTVRFERRFATTVDDLWAATTEPDRVRRWLGPLYGDLAPGARFELRMGDDVPGADQNAVGEVLTCDPPWGFAISWAFPGEVVTRIEVRLRPDGDETVLVLEHSGLQEPAARGYGAGWHASLDLLDDALGGRPVRAWQDAFDAALPRYRQA
ncbi:SRPBCC family protein [Cellulomonas sp. URHB0016]